MTVAPVGAKIAGSADVVGVPVAVDEVGDGFVGDLRDSPLEVLAEQRRGIHHDHTVAGA